MTQPLLSVIIPVYKVEHYLRQCLDSVVNQTYQNLDIILIDDGSPDNCPAICDEYASTDKRIRVIHQSNSGLSKARNEGLNIAKGEYLAFVDSDDYLDSTMFKVIIDKMLTTSSDIGMCGRTDVQNGVSIKSRFIMNSCTLSREEALSLILCDIIGSQSWDKIYKKELFDGVRFPIGRVYEDIATTYLAFDKCQRFCYIQSPLYFYRLNDSGTSFTERPNKIYDTFQSFAERLEFARKKFPEVENKCLQLAFNTAMGTLNYYLRFQFKEEMGNNIVIRNFLEANRRQITSNPLIPLSRKLLMHLFLLNENIYGAAMKPMIKYKYQR